MSQENVEAFKRGLEASNRRDIEALVDTLDPGVSWSPAVPVLLGAEAKVYRGHDGVREMFRGFYDAVDEIHVEYSEIRDLGDRVLGIGRIRTRGKASGAATESPFACISDFKHGKSVRVRPIRSPGTPSKPPGCGNRPIERRESRRGAAEARLDAGRRRE
jgi:ketosteroid isomerase-like protein